MNRSLWWTPHLQFVSPFFRRARRLDFRLLGIALVLILFSLNTALILILSPFGVAWDEWQHFSYAAAVREKGFDVFDAEKLRILDRESGRFSEASNYLAHHPPMFAALVAAVPGDHATEHDRKKLRLIGAMMVVSSNLILFATAFRLIGVRCKTSYVAWFGLSFLFFPVIRAGGLLGNDALAFVAGAVACGAAVKLSHRDPEQANVAAAFLTVVGLSIAGWTKATALLQLAILLLTVLILVFKDLSVRERFRLLAAYGLGCAIGGAPYAWNAVRTGTLLIERYEDMALIHHAAGEQAALPLEFAVSWFSEVANTAVFGGADWLFVGGALLTTLVGMLFVSAHSQKLSVAVLVALAAVVPLHLMHSHSLHSEWGMAPHNAGAHARLYLPLLPAAALGIAKWMDQLPRGPRTAAGFALLTLLVFSGTGMGIANFLASGGLEGPQ